MSPHVKALSTGIPTVLIACASALISCGTLMEDHLCQGYDQVGHVEVPTGGVLMSWQEVSKHPVHQRASNVTHELAYNGIKNGSLFIKHTEYGTGSTRPFYCGEVSYCIGKIREIALRDIVIHVDYAGQDRIIFTIVR